MRLEHWLSARLVWRHQNFWEEPNKAESAKLPGAGIVPKPCPRNSVAEKKKCTASVCSVEASTTRRTARTRTRQRSVGSANDTSFNLGLRRFHVADVRARVALLALPRRSLRTALTFPLFCPPQKNMSPLDSSPEMRIPGGISIVSRTSPVRGSIRLKSLSSSSEVACQSSPSTQVTPVTKRF